MALWTDQSQMMKWPNLTIGSRRPEEAARALVATSGVGAPLFRPLEPKRVCRAWHETYDVKVLVLGFRGAEGREEGKGVIARWGLEKARSKSAERRTVTGYEVWCLIKY